MKKTIGMLSLLVCFLSCINNPVTSDTDTGIVIKGKLGAGYYTGTATASITDKQFVNALWTIPMQRSSYSQTAEYIIKNKIEHMIELDGSFVIKYKNIDHSPTIILLMNNSTTCMHRRIVGLLVTTGENDLVQMPFNNLSQSIDFGILHKNGFKAVSSSTCADIAKSCKSVSAKELESISQTDDSFFFLKNVLGYYATPVANDITLMYQVPDFTKLQDSLTPMNLSWYKGFSINTDLPVTNSQQLFIQPPVDILVDNQKILKNTKLIMNTTGSSNSSFSTGIISGFPNGGTWLISNGSMDSLLKVEYGDLNFNDTDSLPRIVPCIKLEMKENKLVKIIIRVLVKNQNNILNILPFSDAFRGLGYVAFNSATGIAKGQFNSFANDDCATFSMSQVSIDELSELFVLIDLYGISIKIKIIGTYSG